MILLEILETKGISKLQLACKCGMAPSDLYSAIKENKSFYPKWRQSISNILGVDEEILFDGNKLRKKKENLKIIRFNDDNHAERIWINGRFVGTTADLDGVFKKFLKISQEREWGIVESTSVWVCDDFDNINEDTVDEIWDWFNVVEQMTPSQRLAVESKNWEWLIDLI